MEQLALTTIMIGTDRDRVRTAKKIAPAMAEYWENWAGDEDGVDKVYHVVRLRSADILWMEIMSRRVNIALTVVQLDESEEVIRILNRYLAPLDMELGFSDAEFNKYQLMQKGYRIRVFQGILDLVSDTDIEDMPEDFQQNEDKRKGGELI